jgi:hypothetical protein
LSGIDQDAEARVGLDYALFQTGKDREFEQRRTGVAGLSQASVGLPSQHRYDAFGGSDHVRGAGRAGEKGLFPREVPRFKGSHSVPVVPFSDEYVGGARQDFHQRSTAGAVREQDLPSRKRSRLELQREVIADLWVHFSQQWRPVEHLDHVGVRRHLTV